MPIPRLELRVHPQELAAYAARFGETDDGPLFALGERARTRGYLTRAEFLALCAWKTPRSRGLCSANTSWRVRRSTGAALAAVDEADRIGALLGLDGVGMPTASVILHFVHAEPYPVLDVRALWSVGVDNSSTISHTIDLWFAYTRVCRELASATNLSMRAVDRALWQYSKENQR